MFIPFVGETLPSQLQAPGPAPGRLARLDAPGGGGMVGAPGAVGLGSAHLGAGEFAHFYCDLWRVEQETKVDLWG